MRRSPITIALTVALSILTAVFIRPLFRHFLHAVERGDLFPSSAPAPYDPTPVPDARQVSAPSAQPVLLDERAHCFANMGKIEEKARVYKQRHHGAQFPFTPNASDMAYALSLSAEETRCPSGESYKIAETPNGLRVSCAKHGYLENGTVHEA